MSSYQNRPRQCSFTSLIRLSPASSLRMLLASDVPDCCKTHRAAEVLRGGACLRAGLLPPPPRVTWDGSRCPPAVHCRACYQLPGPNEGCLLPDSRASAAGRVHASHRISLDPPQSRLLQARTAANSAGPSSLPPVVSATWLGRPQAHCVPAQRDAAVRLRALRLLPRLIGQSLHPARAQRIPFQHSGTPRSLLCPVCSRAASCEPPGLGPLALLLCGAAVLPHQLPRPQPRVLRVICLRQ